MNSFKKTNRLFSGYAIVFFSLFLCIVACFSCESAFADKETMIATVTKIEKRLVRKGESGMQDDYYIVVKDSVGNNHTLKSRNDLFDGKFDNMGIINNLEVGCTYTFILKGFGKSMFWDYKNILDAKKESCPGQEKQE